MKRNPLLAIIILSVAVISCSRLIYDLETSVDSEFVTVSFYAGARGSFTGERYKNIQVKKNTYLNLNDYLPEIPEQSKNKWQFELWRDSTGETVENRYFVKESESFYAEYIKLCEVEFYNGEELYTKISGIRQNSYLTRPEDPKGENENIHFIGWFDSPTGGKIWNFNDNAVIEDMKLYARWTAELHTLTLNAGDHGIFWNNKKEIKLLIPDGSVISFNPDNKENIPQGEDGWHFLQWEETETGIAVPWDSYVVKEAGNLTAHWAQDKYAVTFVAGTQGFYYNSGSRENSKTVEINAGKTIDLFGDNYTPTCYSGWSVVQWLENGTPVETPEDYTVNKNTRLTASYTRYSLSLYSSDKKLNHLDIGKNETLKIDFRFESESVPPSEYIVMDSGIKWNTEGNESGYAELTVSDDNLGLTVSGKTPSNGSEIIISVNLNGIDSSPLILTVSDYYTIHSPKDLENILNSMGENETDIKIKGDNFFSDSFTYKDLEKVLEKYGKDFSVDLSEAENIVFGECNFSGNNSIKELILPDSLTEIDTGLFYGYRELERVKLPENLKVIGESVFAHSTIKEIILPDSLEKIGAFAFYECHNLQEVAIPGKVTSIGNAAFSGKGLQKITFYGNTNSCSIGTSVFPLDIPIYVYNPENIPSGSPWKNYSLQRL